jgi:hypothetical protein
VDVHCRLQKRHHHAADRKNLAGQDPERFAKPHAISNPNAKSYGESNSFADTLSNTDTEPHRESNPDAKSYCEPDSYTDSHTNPWRLGFQWFLVCHGENPGYGDLPRFLSNRGGDSRGESHCERLGEGQRIVGTPNLGRYKMDKKLASVRINAGSNWTKFTTPVFNAGNRQRVYLSFDTAYSNAAGTMSLDEVFLGTSGGLNRVTNPGFENGNTGWSNDAPVIFSINQGL